MIFFVYTGSSQKKIEEAALFLQGGVLFWLFLFVMKIVETKTQNFLNLQVIGKVVALGTQKIE